MMFYIDKRSFQRKKLYIFFYQLSVFGEVVYPKLLQ